MFDLDKWQEIFNTIGKHPLRTLLTAFGVFWGIFMLVLLLAAGKGLENGVNQNFSSMAKNTMWIWGGKTMLPYKGMKPGRSIIYTNDDYEYLKNQMPGLLYVAPSARLTGSYTINYNNISGTFQVTGDVPDINRVRPMTFTYGRFINDNDVAENRKIAVIGSRVCEVLFGKEDPIGKYIQIKGVYFEVIGQFEVENMGGNGRDDSEKIFIPLSTMQRTFNMMDKIHVFGITPKEGYDPLEVETKVKTYLNAKHFVSPLDKNAVAGWNSGKETEKINGLFTGVNIFIWGVGIMTIIAGIVGVSNIMLIIVKERTKEIGIRKALGATPWSIISLVIQESIFITSLAGYFGLLAGILLVEGAKSMMEGADTKNSYFSNPDIDINVAVTATIILVVSGALAGLIPAIKAARISPIEALRAD
ncbi:MAG: ABC transporter permease [Cytophagales bacterium]|nr:ABC transporter permease [Cytophaga sp.]